jgi:hypothetical protein
MRSLEAVRRMLAATGPILQWYISLRSYPLECNGRLLTRVELNIGRLWPGRRRAGSHSRHRDVAVNCLSPRGL